MIRFSQAKADLKLVGVTLRKTGYGAEIRVNVSGRGEATAYYTDDVEDAWLTGRRMAYKAGTLPQGVSYHA